MVGLHSTRFVLRTGCAGVTLTLALSGYAMADDFRESPMLNAMVETGALPPVTERLPATPEVVEPLNSVGAYGGMIRSALRGNADHNGILLLVGAQGLVRWERDMSGVVPNLAESWEVNDDATEFTFRLREGVRWSDGALLTTDDVIFAAELLAHGEFLEAVPTRYVAGGEPMQVEKVDDLTFTITFVQPYSTFIEELAKPVGQHLVLYSRAYCGQYHPDYAGPEELARHLAGAGTDSWAQLMRMKCADIELPTRWGNVDRPTLDPWVITEPYSGGATQVQMERNPYFWQVDTEGHQLPYADALQFSIIADPEAILLSAMNGQLDYQVRHIFSISNRPVLSENAQRGNYQIMGLTPLDSNFLGLYLNHSNENEVLRDLIRTREFKEALSHGIDRVEVDDIVQLGQGEPWQIGPLPSSDFYHEQLATQHIEHDPSRSNELLDELGLTDRDSSGYRQMPNGDRLALRVITSIAHPAIIEALEVIRGQWREIGVELVIATSERSLFYERAQRNEFDLSASNTPGAINPMGEMRAFAAVHPLESRMSLPWVRWHLTGGEEGEEPTENMKRRLELIESYRSVTDPDEARAIVMEILDLAAEAFEVIGVSQRAPALGIRANNLHNVYEQMPYGWEYGTPGPSLPQQWYFQ